MATKGIAWNLKNWILKNSLERGESVFGLGMRSCEWLELVTKNGVLFFVIRLLRKTFLLSFRAWLALLTFHRWYYFYYIFIISYIILYIYYYISNLRDFILILRDCFASLQIGPSKNARCLDRRFLTSQDKEIISAIRIQSLWIREMCVLIWCIIYGVYTRLICTTKLINWQLRTLNMQWLFEKKLKLFHTPDI